MHLEQNLFPEKAPEKYKLAIEAHMELIQEALKRDDFIGSSDVVARSHAPEIIELMNKVKEAFDPANVANPPLSLGAPKKAQEVMKEIQKKMGIKH